MQLTVGALLLPVQLARKPKVVDALAPSAPFQASLVTVYGLAVLEVRPPQSWVIRWPFGNVSTTLHAVVAVVPVLATVTSPWKPPDQLAPIWR